MIPGSPALKADIFLVGHSGGAINENKNNKSRVSDQDGISQACYIVEINHFGLEPSKLTKGGSSHEHTVNFSLLLMNTALHLP